MDKSGHNPDLGLTRGDNARTVRPDQPTVAPLQVLLRHHHILNRNPFGDANDDFYSRIGRFHNGIRGKCRRDKDDGHVSPGFLHRIAYRIEYRLTQVIPSALSGSDATDHIGAVFNHLGGVKCSFGAGKSLHDHFRILVNQDAHKKAFRV
jgi:hypothetical protein